MKSTYAGVGLGEALEHTDVEGSHARGAGLAVVLVEPKVVAAVGAQVLLVTVQVSVPTRHFINNYNFTAIKAKHDFAKPTFADRHARRS